MENKGQIDTQEARMQGLIDRFLKVRSANFTRSEHQPHLDDDTLSAFAEGTLSEREAQPIVSHLVDCSFCRHVTAELVRLDLAFAADEAIVPAKTANEPSKVSEVLSSLLSRIFGTADNAVFAHQEEEKEAEKDDDKEDKEV